MDDARFDTYHGHWEQIENDKTVELFLDELLLPLVEVYGLGALAKYDAGKLADLRQRMRLIHDEHLAGLGILLRNRQKGLVDGLKYALMELVENKNLRTDLLGMIREALAESDYNKFVFEGAEKRLSSRASATGVAAAIEALLVSGDVAKIMLDLASAPAAVSWTVVTTPALFVLMPEEARVSKANGSVRFEVEPRGEAAGNYLHRWTTSGDHGSLSDLDDDGPVLTTSAPEIWYFHDDPAHIRATDVDTITLEVFSVAEGVTTVPGGAQPIATLTATVTGDDREIPAGITVLHGITDILPGVYEEQWPCVAMYFSFPAGGTTSYEVQLEGLSVPSGSEHQAYNNHALEGRTSYDVSFSENDVYPWVDGCKWRDQDGDVDLARPDDVRAFRDDSTYWIHLFSAIHDELWDDYGRPPLGEVVEHWYDWVDGASITVVPE
jgi:hypothetical protein